MQIDYLLMKNFRQYADTKIEFARSKESNFTVIEGENGAGKTNILNAITWCLYGNENHIDTKYGGLPRVHIPAFEQTKNEPVEVVVEIQLIDSDGNKRKITRKQIFRKLDEARVVESPALLSYMWQEERDWKGPSIDSDAQYVINNLIPESLEEYFFFDGERMDLYFREKSHKEIKEAVFQISQLEMLDVVIDHLGARRSILVKAAKGLSPKVKELQEKIEIYQRSQRPDSEELASKLQEKEKKEQEERGIIEKLRKSSYEHIRELQKRRDELEEELKGLTRDIKALEDSQLQFLHSKMPSLFCYNALTLTGKLIQNQKEAGQIPPLIQGVFIKGLLQKNRCICGSDLSKKDEYSIQRRKKVESLLEEKELSSISAELIETNLRTIDLLQGIEGFKERSIEISKKINELKENKKPKIANLERLADELKNSDIEAVSKLEEDRQKVSYEKEEIVGRIAVLRNTIERRDAQIRQFQKDLNDELQEENKFNFLASQLSVCNEAAEAADYVKTTIMFEVKNEIEKQTSQQFLSLIWKKGTYKGVKIDDDYNISVPHVSGREGLGTLSAGERQVCALSFMAALNNVSGFDVPLIIDTPLGRISNEPTKNIAENLPKYLKGKQVTLLVTDKEFSKEVQESLSNKIGKTYKIDVQEKELGNLAEVRLVK